MSAPAWDPKYELSHRPAVPDRTGQTWEIGDYGPHLVIGPPWLAEHNNSSGERWVHPTIVLTTGKTKKVGEWIDEPWATRDSKTWVRVA